MQRRPALFAKMTLSDIIPLGRIKAQTLDTLNAHTHSRYGKKTYAASWWRSHGFHRSNTIFSTKFQCQSASFTNSSGPMQSHEIETHFRWRYAAATSQEGSPSAKTPSENREIGHFCSHNGNSCPNECPCTNNTHIYIVVKFRKRNWKIHRSRDEIRRFCSDFWYALDVVGLCEQNINGILLFAVFPLKCFLI